MARSRRGKLRKKKTSIRRTIDPVVVQISAVLTRKLKKEYTLSGKVLEEAVRRKAELSSGVWSHRLQRVVGAEEGPDPTGIKLKIIRWKNPARRGSRAGWRTGTQAEAWGSLRGLLRSARIIFKGLG